MVTGMKEHLSKVLGLQNAIDKIVLKKSKRFATAWKGDVQSRTPVDKGQLRRNWKSRTTLKRGSGVKIKLSNNTEYAEHVEFGHRTRGGKSTVEGRYMLNSTHDKWNTKANTQLVSEITKEIDRTCII